MRPDADDNNRQPDSHPGPYGHLKIWILEEIMHFENTQALTNWLVQVLSEETDLSLEDIDPKASFAALGIDSVESVSLACRLDEAFEGFTVKPDLFWEVDCIDELAQELFDRTVSVGA
jgi:acyl carrier protein